MNTQKKFLTMLASILMAGFTAATLSAQTTAEEAKSMLKAMSDYVGSQQTIELTFDSDIEIITPQLEKIQFTNSGEALLKRPDGTAFNIDQIAAVEQECRHKV